ncbi:MAG: hypothetical protein M1834_001866 [Cirrosporium novae-zelandiae]|nr:MAG: hypothetical protein M1834_001866 [Cirrosporium novae-zelandiae]
MNSSLSTKSTPNSSPWKGLRDSPSRQLLIDLSRLQIAKTLNFQEQLDELGRRRAEGHKKALSAASLDHDSVRSAAETLLAELAAKQEAERRKVEEGRLAALRKRQEEERKRHEAERLRAEAEAEAKVQEEIRRQEQQRKAAETRKQQEEQALQQAERARVEKAKADAEAAAEESRKQEVRKRELSMAQAKEAEAIAQIQAQKKGQPITLSPEKWPEPGAHIPDRKRQEHERYLEIHKHLKEFREWMNQQRKAKHPATEKMSDWRREITKRVGQVVLGKGGATAPSQEIRKVLEAASKVQSPPVNIREFLAHPPNDGSDGSFSALVLFLLNSFVKAILKQFIAESGVRPETANNIGVLFSQTMRTQMVRWNNIPLIDIFLAKYHKICPILFGYSGPEQTVKGKKAIGWYFDKYANGGQGQWVTKQIHEQRMIGLAAGFAACSMRIYPKPGENPFPSPFAWYSFSCLLNPPVEEMTPTHFIVLRWLIAGNERRMVRIWGNYAHWILKRCLEILPTQVAFRNDPAAESLMVLKETLQDQEKLKVGMTGREDMPNQPTTDIGMN